MGIGNDLSGDRPNEPTLEQRMSSMTDDDMVYAIRFGIAHDLLGRVAHGDCKLHLERLVCEPSTRALKDLVVLTTRVFDECARLYVIAELRRPCDGEHMQFSCERPRQVRRKTKRIIG
jgi:hypothetical protein